MKVNQKANLISKVLINHPNCIHCGIHLVQYRKSEKNNHRLLDMAVVWMNRSTRKNTVMCVTCANIQNKEWEKQHNVNLESASYSDPLPIKDKDRKELELVLDIYRAKLKLMFDKYSIDSEDINHIKKLFSHIHATNYYSRTGKFLGDD